MEEPDRYVYSAFYVLDTQTGYVRCQIIPFYNVFKNNIFKNNVFKNNLLQNIGKNNRTTKTTQQPSQEFQPVSFPFHHSFENDWPIQPVVSIPLDILPRNPLNNNHDM